VYAHPSRTELKHSNSISDSEGLAANVSSAFQRMSSELSYLKSCLWINYLYILVMHMYMYVSVTITFVHLNTHKICFEKVHFTLNI